MIKFKSKSILNNFIKHFYLSKVYLNSIVKIGDSVSIERIFSKEDIEMFAKLTNDFNPIHFDQSAAQKQNFSQPIVHGALINGLLSIV